MTTTQPRSGVTSRDYEGRYDVGQMITDAKAVISDLAKQATEKKGELRVHADTDFTQERAQDVARILRYIAHDPRSAAKDYTSQLLFYVAINQGEGEQFSIAATGKDMDRFAIDLRTVESILRGPISAQEFVERAIKAELKPSGALVGA